MKTSILVVAVISSLFAFSLPASAQQTQPAETKPKMEMKMHNMMGCLAKGDGGSYQMTNDDPKGPKMIGIVSSTADLAPHVGHDIQITGVEVPMKEAEAMKGVPKADHYMKVSKVKDLSASCK